MPKKEKVFRCAMYLRLSKEDDSIATASNSIVNQEKMIRMYIGDHDDLVFKKKYVDDGVSGSGFDRTGFNQMMRDADAGEIDCIIVKDLSRFGRNSIDVGHYIEEIFPYTGLRFIAINDRYDSNNYVGDAGGFEISIKNLISQIYAQDASKKSRQAFNLRLKTENTLVFKRYMVMLLMKTKSLYWTENLQKL